MSVDPSQFTGYSPLQSGVSAAPGSQGSLSQGQQLINQQLAQQQGRLESGEKLSNTGYDQAAGANADESKSYSALKDLLLKTQQRLGDLQYSPSPQEALLKSMSAFAGAKPGLGGIAAAGAAAAQSGAETLQQQREGALQREQLMSKYGIDAQQADQMANQLKMQMANNMITKGQQQQNNATTGINSALGRQTSLDVAGMNAANKPVNVNVNGQPQVNQPVVDAAAAAAGAKKKAELTAMNNGIDPETIDTLAEAYRKVGASAVPYGMQKNNPMLMPAVVQAALHKEEMNGGNANSLIYGQMLAKAGQQSMGQLTKQQELVGAFEKTAGKNLDLVLDKSQQADRTGVPIINRWLNAGKVAITGDKDVILLNNTIGTAMDEYAKVLSGSMGNTALSDAKIKQAQGMLSSAQTPEDIKAVVALMHQEMDNRTSSFVDQQSELRQMMEQHGLPKQGAPAVPGAPQEGAKQVGKGGRPMIFKSGAWHYSDV